MAALILVWCVAALLQQAAAAQVSPGSGQYAYVAAVQGVQAFAPRPFGSTASRSRPGSSGAGGGAGLAGPAGAGLPIAVGAGGHGSSPPLPHLQPGCFTSHQGAANGSADADADPAEDRHDGVTAAALAWGDEYGLASSRWFGPVHFVAERFRRGLSTAGRDPPV